jgi:transposase
MAKEPKISFEDLEVGKLDALRLKLQPLLEAEDFQLLDRVITTLVLVLDCIQKKNMSIRRLLRMIFGRKTETSHNLLPKDKEKEKEKDQAAAPQSSGSSAVNPPSDKRKGHGRNGAEDYPGAERIAVPHQSLQAGDPCPLCPEGGRLYNTGQPVLFIRVVAQPIFPATI